MARYERFSFLCSEEERRFITILANKLHRTQSDAVRFVVFNAVCELEGNESLKKEDSIFLTAKGDVDE